MTPAVGAAVVAAGYDRDFDALPPDGPEVDPVRVPSLDTLSLQGRLLFRTEALVLDLNGVVKGRTVDDALAGAGADWVNAGGDLATRVPLRVEVPGATSSPSPRAAWPPAAWRTGGGCAAGGCSII